jgi:hypothetical protein
MLKYSIKHQIHTRGHENQNKSQYVKPSLYNL